MWTPRKAPFTSWICAKAIQWCVERAFLEMIFDTGRRKASNPAQTQKIASFRIVIMAQTGQSLSAVNLDNIPAAPPPPGVVPNFIHPENQLAAINTTLIICLSFATIFVWLRIYTKFLINKTHGYEDCAFNLLLLRKIWLADYRQTHV